MRQILLILFLLNCSALGHPVGNIIRVNDNILWPYVDPVGDIYHHASIMIWDQNSEPKTFLVSEKSGSNYILFNQDEHIYIVENWQNNAIDVNMTRILKTDLSSQLNVIWPWFKDESRIGNHGFYMKSDSSVVYGEYPNIYIMTRGENPALLFKTDYNVDKVRYLDSNHLLIISEADCYLTDHQGNVKNKWSGITEQGVENAPLGRNIIHDADYYQGKLLIANWGKQSFEIIDKENRRKTIKQLSSTRVPHWVSFNDGKYLLFSSIMDFNNPFNENKSKTTIAPYFLIYDNQAFINVWPQD